MSYLSEYQRWLTLPTMDADLKAELIAMEGDDKAIKDAFHASLSFGTAGLRGIMGAGLNRMNRYTVARATLGLARNIALGGREACEKGCAIAYDSRNNSPLFARISACVLASQGIKVWLFDELRPTPELSFAIRKYGYAAGINITASHNPKEYNGYKVYGEDGAQLGPAAANRVSSFIEECDIFSVPMADFEEAKKQGLITILGKEADEDFLDCVLSCAINPQAVAASADSFKVVYTPFHGAGYRLVPEVLRRLGLKQIICVPEQMVIDGNFPTVASPNPENKEGFARAIEIARENNVDLIIGTDPDADRAGTVVRNAEGDYVTLSGNQMGVLLLEYIISNRKALGTLSDKAVAITSCVSTRMTEAVAKANGVTMDYCFTGFKFIADRMNHYLADGYQFLLGFEESYGYLMGDYARDKDAVGAAAMIAEMAAYYHQQGKTLYDVITECYNKYGFYSELTLNLVMPGLDGLDKMKKLMDSLHSQPPRELGGMKVLAVADHLSGIKKYADHEEALPSHLIGSNVVAFTLESGSEFIVRPSGTEPKVKVYLMTKASSYEEGEAIKARLAEAARALV